MLRDITIKDKIYKVSVADTETSRYAGLSNLEKLGNNKGLLFVYDAPTKMTMVMRNMKFALDFIFVSEDWKIVDLGSLEKNAAAGITPDTPAKYVLELNKGEIAENNFELGDLVTPSPALLADVQPVKVLKNGGTLELVGEKFYEVRETVLPVETNKLQILDENGVVIANVDGGSRVFSRRDTKKFVEKFKEGNKIELAKALIQALDEQDSRPEQYVSKED
jgi:uncharacterized protein